MECFQKPLHHSLPLSESGTFRSEVSAPQDNTYHSDFQRPYASGPEKPTEKTTGPARRLIFVGGNEKIATV